MVAEVGGPGERSAGLAPAPTAAPAATDTTVADDPASPTHISVSLRDCPLSTQYSLEGATPSFVRFDRSGDEGEFWPIKWRRVFKAPVISYPRDIHGGIWVFVE